MNELRYKDPADALNAPRTRFDVGAARIDRVVEFEQPLLDPLEIYHEATADIASQLSWLAPHFYDPAKKLLVTPLSLPSFASPSPRTAASNAGPSAYARASTRAARAVAMISRY